MADELIRGTAMDGFVRFIAARTTAITEEARRRHGLFPVASAALGRTMTAGLMMGAMLKEESHKLTIQVKGNGPLGQIVVDVNALGDVRGYVDNPAVDLPLNDKGKLDVAGAVGEGYLYVTKNIGLKEPYRGGVPLISGELGEDFTYYFAKSEQTPSVVAVGVLVGETIRAAGGFMLQILPGAGEEVIERLEAATAVLPPVTAMLDEGYSLDAICEKAVGPLQSLERQSIQFRCFCSRDRVERTLLSLGREELASLVEEGKAEVICHFCNEAYRFGENELKQIETKLV